MTLRMTEKSLLEGGRRRSSGSFSSGPGTKASSSSSILEVHNNNQCSGSEIKNYTYILNLKMKIKNFKTGSFCKREMVKKVVNNGHVKTQMG